MPYYSQLTEVWCWAAVIEMVSAYKGNHVAQCQTLDFAFNVNGCCFNPQFCATTGSIQQIQNSLSALGIGNQYVSRALSWGEVVNEIDNGRPMILFYSGSFVGHVVVLYGYNEQLGTVNIHDPFYGTFEVPFGDSYLYAGSLTWTGTLANLN